MDGRHARPSPADERHDPPCLPVVEEGDDGEELGRPGLASEASWAKRPRGGGVFFCFKVLFVFCFLFFYTVSNYFVHIKLLQKDEFTTNITYHLFATRRTFYFRHFKTLIFDFNLK